MTAPAAIPRLVVAFNSAEALRVQADTSAPGPTTIVDNASTDDTRDVAASLGHAVLALPANAGFGAAIMAGLKAHDAPLVLVINPDVAVLPGCDAALLRAAEAYPDCDLFVPRLLDAHGHAFFRHECRFEPRVRDRTPPDGDCCIRALSGAAMLIRREAFLAHGGFDPRIFLYFEDDDLALRYWSERRPIILVDAARARHAGDASVHPDARANAIKDQSFGWSMLYIGSRHFGRSGWVDVAQLGLKLVLYGLSGRRERIRRTLGRLRGAARFLAGKDAPFRP